VAAGYLSRRIGRSQNGMGGCLSSVRWFAGWPPASGDSGAGGFGLGPDRCRALAAGHPLDGHEGREPVPLLIGGADLAGPAPPEDVARAREGPASAERPAPRDQPEAAAPAA
jgi:hypothetical protein